ncbi:MAG: response regulator [Cyanobacteria bacterium J06634_5]
MNTSWSQQLNTSAVPAATVPEAAVEAELEPCSPVADIMVVDDTPANLHLLIKILAAQGYNIRPITSGAQALASAQVSPPDVILLDIKMPGMDGYEVCKRLKADERTQDIPVMFLTVLDDVNDIVKGFELGGVDYITKPVREGELLARVNNQLELRSLQKQLRQQNEQQKKLLIQYERTAAALKESEEKFSTAFHNTPLPTTIVALRSEHYIDVNHAFVQRSGYSREEIIGHTATELKLWESPEQRSMIFEQLKSQGHSHGTEIGMRTKSGKVKSIVLFLELIQLKGELYVLGTGEDITQYKADQKKLTAQTQTLSKTLKTLQTTQGKLIRSAKMAALGNLVAGVAHEINTPVGTAIMTASTLENATQSIAADLAQGDLKRSSFENYLEISADCAHLILNNLHRAGELVTSFKEVAVDQTSLQKRVFKIKPYLKEIITNLTPQLKKTAHQVQLLGDDTLIVDSYPGGISQVITNLITNSLAHAYADGESGTVTITVEASTVDAATIILTYHDDGCGIALADQSRIFEPFFTTARNFGGSGLGLHLVYNLVTQMLKGDIQLVSSPEQGTTFTITFPSGQNQKCSGVGDS